MWHIIGGLFQFLLLGQKPGLASTTNEAATVEFSATIELFLIAWLHFWKSQWTLGHLAAFSKTLILATDMLSQRRCATASLTALNYQDHLWLGKFGPLIRCWKLCCVFCKLPELKAIGKMQLCQFNPSTAQILSVFWVSKRIVMSETWPRESLLP